MVSDILSSVPDVSSVFRRFGVEAPIVIPTKVGIHHWRKTHEMIGGLCSDVDDKKWIPFFNGMTVVNVFQLSFC